MDMGLSSHLGLMKLFETPTLGGYTNKPDLTIYDSGGALRLQVFDLNVCHVLLSLSR